MASPMLHLLEGPMWLTDSRAFDDERDRQLPRTVNAPQRVRELNDAMLQTVDREHDLRLWQIVVVELPTHRIGPVRAQLRLLQKGRTVYMYELRRFGSLPLKDEEKVTVHAELTTSTGVVLSTFARGAVIGLPHRLDAPTSVRFDSA